MDTSQGVETDGLGVCINKWLQKIGITDLDTDAIVNAANDGLWAGGGVCGAIFRAAGYDKLQAACDAWGCHMRGEGVPRATIFPEERSRECRAECSETWRGPSTTRRRISTTPYAVSRASSSTRGTNVSAI